MKKLAYIAALAILLGAAPAALAATTQSAQGQNLGYTPLEPIPGVTIGSNGSTALTFPALLNNIFYILITLGALTAVLMLVVGGVEYMVAESVGKKAGGLRRARSALWGILLVAGSWLILHTINPTLLNFTLITCPQGSNYCSTADNSITTTSNNTNSGGGGGGTSDTNSSGTGGSTGSGGTTDTSGNTKTTQITVTPISSYSAESSFGKQVAGVLTNGTLVDTKSGVAVEEVSNNDLSYSTVTQALNTFTQDCQAVSGSVLKQSGSASTLYACVSGS